MAQIPEPEQTPEGPTYEGRLLVRPDEEVVDQGAGFDIRTLVTRRGVLGIVGVGVGAVALAACSPSSSGSLDGSGSATSSGSGTTDSSSTAAQPSASATSSATDDATSSTTTDLPASEIPDETAGPYPADGSNEVDGVVVDVLEESGVVRQDLRTSIDGGDAVPGVLLSTTFAITDMADGDAPFAGVAVYAWHCDAQGRYSMYSDGVQDQTWLRGVQVADSDGRVTFTSIVPGCYSGRWTHLHFEVYPDVDSIIDASNAIATSQMAFPQEVLDVVYELDDYAGSAENLAQITLATDNVFGEDGGALQMATMSGDVTGGNVASLTVGIDSSTTPTAGAAPSGAGGGPGGSGGAPPSS